MIDLTIFGHSPLSCCQPRHDFYHPISELILSPFRIFPFSNQFLRTGERPATNQSCTFKGKGAPLGHPSRPVTISRDHPFFYTLPFHCQLFSSHSPFLSFGEFIPISYLSCVSSPVQLTFSGMLSSCLFSGAYRNHLPRATVYSCV